MDPSLKTRVNALLLVLIVVVAAFGLGLAVRDMSKRPKSTNETPQAPPVDSVDSEEEGEIETLSDPSGLIQVTNMRSGQRLPNGFVVRGQAVAFESRFAWRVEDANSKVIGRGNATSWQPDVGVHGPFAIPALFDEIPTTDTGTLVVYEESAADGSDIHVVRIPVRLSRKTQNVNVYFGNAKMNPDPEDCARVYSVSRTVAEGTLPYIAIHALLKGPTEAERAEGFTTNIPEGVALEGAMNFRGEPALDFSYDLQGDLSGECTVKAIRAQIEYTATQGGVSNDGGVHLPISISGSTDDVLEP